MDDTIKLPNDIRNRISESLKPLHPEKVILFGTYAWGHPTEDSDIDLIAVLRDRQEINWTFWGSSVP